MQSKLIARETTYEMFIQKLVEGKTNGIDIAILAICEMFDISIIVLFENFLWKLDEIPLDDFDICMIVFSKGRYMSATRQDNTKVEVEIHESVATTVQCLKLSQYMGAHTETIHRNAVGRNRKRKLGNVQAELADHNYSTNIENQDFLNGSNISSILGVQNY